MMRGSYRLALFFVTTGLVMLSWAAYAAQPTATQLNDPNFLPGNWPTVVSSINKALNAALTDKTYAAWTKGLFAGGLVITSMIELARWVGGTRNVGQLIEFGVTVIALVAIYGAYSVWTYWLFAAGYELGAMIEQATLGVNTLYGPSEYVIKVLSSYAVDNSGSILNFSIVRFIEGTALLLLSFALDIAAYMAVMWPTLIYMLAKLIGPVFFVTLVHEKTSFLFDGWFKMLLMSAVYVLVGRVTVIIISLLLVAFTSINMSASVNPQMIVIPTENIGAYLTIVVLMAISILFIFCTGAFTALLIGGSDISLTKTVSSLAKTAARFL